MPNSEYRDRSAAQEFAQEVEVPVLRVYSIHQLSRLVLAWLRWIRTPNGSDPGNQVFQVKGRA